MKRLALLLLIICSGFYSSAQKIKYKDLYVLLRAKNYKDGASFLNKFLATSPDHPNANYQMGLMLEFKLNKLDMLKESDAIIQKADSAILYFDKAYALVNAKEVKKHDDDYYESFKRRNLRTGKFEVILSDVQLDIENRKNSLQTKKSNIKTINEAFSKATTFYEETTISYKYLKEKYNDELSLSLGASDSVITLLNTLVLNYDSSLYQFKNYLSLKKTLESSLSNAVVVVNDIDGFSEAPFEMPDFYATKVGLFNFSDWGKRQLEEIKLKEEFINNIVLFDFSLDELDRQIRNDSIDLSSEVFKKITDPHLKEFKSIDSKSLVYRLFHYKIGQLNLNSTLMNWYRNYEDSLDVGAQLNVVSNLKKEMEGVSSLYLSLQDYDDTLFTLRYHRFITERYQDKNNMLEYIYKQKAIVDSQAALINKLETSIMSKNQWGFYGSDSISLSVSKDSTLSYQTLYLDSLGNNEYQLAGYTNINDEANLFFAVVPSSRMIDTVYVINTKLTYHNISVKSVEANTGFYVYLLGNTDSSPEDMLLLYFSNRTGIGWSKTISLKAGEETRLVYEQGLIEVHQGDVVKKYHIDEGSDIN